MMPFLPVVRVRNVDAAIQASVRAEHGHRHTAMIHSRTWTMPPKWRAP
jgi:hypothetical protein